MRQIVERLPLSAGGRVLDMACGDGQYARFLDDRVGPRGIVVGADVAQEYSQIVRDVRLPTNQRAFISLQRGSNRRLLPTTVSNWFGVLTASSAFAALNSL